ncbi:uncharacterized protein Lmpt isoform X1 [Chironomus tepperi]|uniref:uncharacterized protein Lmpt isoform X1 n=1 Tax=Chironomus tepperi TaxID=113505 RepID=UPI00391F277C
MNGKEDFGPLVDALVACVGAMDVISVVAFMYNLASYKNLSLDINNNEVKVTQDKSQHAETNDILSRSKDSGIPLVIVDKSKLGDDVIDSLVTKVNALNDKVTELVQRSRENSMERFLDIERERYRRSRSPSPINRDDEQNSDDENESHGNAEYDYHQSKGITRDDEFRKTIKRSSQVSSQHESREEELAHLTEIEAEEMNNMDDYVPLTYQSDENDDNIIETIEETPTCPIHGKIDEILASGSGVKSLDENDKTTEISVGDAKSQNENKKKVKLDINENFIKMEKNALQQQANTSRLLMKQGNVGSDDFPDETINEIILKRDENITTESKLVENVLIKAHVEESPKLENFPKSLEITSSTNEITSELISTLEDTQKVNMTNVEDFSKVDVKPSVMVRSFAEVLTSNDIIVEDVTELKNQEQVPVVEVISEPQSVIGSLMEVNLNPTSNYSLGSTATPSLNSYSNTNLNMSMSSLQNKSENISLASSAFDNDFAVRRKTPDPDIILIKYRLKLIFSGEYTKAMSKDWHSGHFCCWNCDESLTGQRYVLRDEHPYCIKCYESVFANTCEECSTLIGIDSKDLSYKDKHWHEACFLCNMCRVSLVDKQFGSKTDKIYCGNCYDSQFASRCDGCGEVFRAGTKKMEYKTRQWHEKCFCCNVCKTPIGTKSFIPREQDIYCAGCYEDKFATRCIKCKKVITTGGVTYKNDPFHRECFVCTHCETPLAGQRFTSRDEKPYCADCFGDLFAKRCTACTKPITGIGGTKFISFEDRHWHNDCFTCGSCKTSLVGRGFITDEEDDIICPDCAKAKLMAS